MSRKRTPTPFTRGLGGRVRTLRGQRGWTMGDLADHSGLNKTYVGQIERGERNPSAWTVVVLAAGLGVSPDLLLQGLAASNPADDPTPSRGKGGDGHRHAASPSAQ